jgi:hypothetical protein
VQENFQTSYLQNRKRPHHTAKDWKTRKKIVYSYKYCDTDSVVD